MVLERRNFTCFGMDGDQDFITRLHVINTTILINIKHNIQKKEKGVNNDNFKEDIIAW